MIKDSGNRTEFDSGAVRDIQEGKGILLFGLRADKGYVARGQGKV